VASCQAYQESLAFHLVLHCRSYWILYFMTDKNTSNNLVTTLTLEQLSLLHRLPSYFTLSPSYRRHRPSIAPSPPSSLSLAFSTVSNHNSLLRLIHHPSLCPFYLLHYFKPFHHLSIHNMFVIQPWSLHCSNEEL